MRLRKINKITVVCFSDSISSVARFLLVRQPDHTTVNSLLLREWVLWAYRQQQRRTVGKHLP